MTTHSFYPASGRILLQSLCRPPQAALPMPSLAGVFCPARPTANFHCTSFFRSEQAGEKEYDPWQPLCFRDGRVYEVLDLKLVCGNGGDVSRRCCVDVIERTSSEFVPFEAWFYESALEEGRFQASFEQGMIRATRQWIWEFLYTKRNAVDWSRYGMPYVQEYR